MKINVTPLMSAIERYIAKAGDDLEEKLSEEGYVNAAGAVEAINDLEDSVRDALEEDAESFLENLKEYDDVESFMEDAWPSIGTSEELKEVLKMIFRKKFDEMLKSFTFEWILSSEPDLADIFLDEPRVTAPTNDFISSWSTQLADLMHLTTCEQMEGILRKAKDEHLSIEDTAELIAEKGIRAAGYRARTVATTEVLRVESYYQQEAMVQNPLTYAKRWKHVLSAEPRKNHMAINGQQVFKRETFTLVGADGSTYHPLCPRDTSLPASESINCHCLMEEVKDESALGMSKEEMKKLREQTMDEVDAEWATNHAGDKIKIILDMNEEDQIRFFGGKKDGKARLALIKSGVIDTDEKLEKLYKTEESGKKSLKLLQELAEDGIFTVSNERLKHSVLGDYSTASKQYPYGRMKAGGHSQAAMNMCDEKKIEYTVTKTFSNGVRIGNVPSSGMAMKRSRNGQAWFPESWNEEKILIAGTTVANNGVPFEDGVRKTGVYDGVAVRVLMNNGVIGTVCPDLEQEEYLKG